MSQTPRIVADCVCVTGEGPLWHPDEDRLYWVDIPAGRLFRYSPGAGATEEFDLGAPVGGMTLEADGALLLFMARGAVGRWVDGTQTAVVDGIPDERGNRFNDVIADPEGRVFCGTMSTDRRAGRLYRLDPDRALTVVLEGIGTSNGLGFTPDRRGLYYTDTRKHDIYRFDYDRATGALANRRVFVHVDEGPSRPDGLTVDAEGCVWSARWEGGCVVRYDPAGREMLRVDVPGALNVSSLTFGGRDYTDIYVTTAGGDDRAKNGPAAGALFRVNLGIRGVPEFRSRLAARRILRRAQRAAKS